MNNTTENKVSEKVKEIFAEVRENPGKFARLILSQNRGAFIRNDGKKFNITEAVIATQKGNQPMTIIRFSPQKSEFTLLSVIRKNKYVAYVMGSPEEDERCELYEVRRKDHSSELSLFIALLNTDLGTVVLVCDNRYEDFLYNEFWEISTEPSFYRSAISPLMEVMKTKSAEEEKNDPKKA